MVNLPEDGPNTAAESESILTGLGAGQGRRPGRGSGKKKTGFKTSFNDMDETSKAVIEGLRNVKTTAPTGEEVASPSKWPVTVSGRGGMATSITVPGARPRNHFDDFEDLHDDLDSAVQALGATVNDIPASKSGAGASVEQQRGVYEIARGLLANASAHMANAGVAHTAGKYVSGGVKLEKSQPKADKGLYEIANEVTPLVPGEYVKKTTALTGKEGPKSAADHMKLAAAAYGQVGNLLSEASRTFGQKFKNSYGKTGQGYGVAANEIADDYAKRLSRDPGYASVINTGSDKAWEPFSVKPVASNPNRLFPGTQEHDINASRTVKAAQDVQTYNMKKLEEANRNVSAFNALKDTRKQEARKAQDEAFATYAPNLAASAEIDRKNDVADRQARFASRDADAAATRSRVDAKAQEIADNHNETFEPMKQMLAGVQKVALDAQDKGAELHKDVFKHIGNAVKAFGFHAKQVASPMPYLADVTKHTDKAMDEVTNAARRLQQSGIHHPLLTSIVQDGEAQLAAGKYAGRLRTVNNAGFASKPTIDTSRIDPTGQEAVRAKNV